MSEHEMRLGDINLTSNSFVVSVSREQLLDMGQIEPTPEELADRNEKSKMFHADQRAKRGQFIKALDRLGNSDALTMAILELHAPDLDAEYGSDCLGCDVAGYDGEQPEWPCRTIDLVAAQNGISLPSGTLPGKRYEDEFVPSDGKVIDWSSIYRPMWHAVAAQIDDETLPLP